MSCKSCSQFDTERNIDLVTHKGVKTNFWYFPNLPITTQNLPTIRTRQVALKDYPVAQVGFINNQDRDMRYSFGCTNCIRNRTVIFSP